MKLQTSLLGALILSALTVTAVQAQSDRPGDKAEAAVAAASQLKGELSTPNQDKGTSPSPSVVSRDEVKTDATSARAAGNLPKGERSTASQGSAPAQPANTDKSRDDVKAEAAAAKESDAVPKGQMSTPNQDKGAGNKP